MDKEVGLEEVVVAMAGVAMGAVVGTEVPALDQEAIRRGDQSLIAIRAPLEGETPTGGERTEFLPRSSKDFSKPFLNTHLNTIKIIQNPGYQKRRGQGG